MDYEFSLGAFQTRNLDWLNFGRDKGAGLGVKFSVSGPRFWDVSCLRLADSAWAQGFESKLFGC